MRFLLSPSQDNCGRSRLEDSCADFSLSETGTDASPNNLAVGRGLELGDELPGFGRSGRSWPMGIQPLIAAVSLTNPATIRQRSGNQPRLSSQTERKVFAPAPL